MNKIQNDQTHAEAEFTDELRHLELKIEQSRNRETTLIEELAVMKNDHKALEKKTKELLLKVKDVKDINREYRKELHDSRSDSAKLNVEVKDCNEKYGKLVSEFDLYKLENKDFRYELLNEARGKLDNLGTQVQSAKRIDNELDNRIGSLESSLTGALNAIKLQINNIKYENKQLRYKTAFSAFASTTKTIWLAQQSCLMYISLTPPAFTVLFLVSQRVLTMAFIALQSL